MNINKYIVQLLSRYGMANVPGVGTFRLEHKNAYLMESSILPPGDFVVFAENTQCRDNALAELVMRDLRIKFEDAVNLVEESTKELDVNALIGWSSQLPANYGFSIIPVAEIHHQNLFASFGKYAAAVAFAFFINLTVPVNNVSDNHVVEARLIPEFFANTEKEVSEIEIIEETEPKDYCVIISSLNSREDAVNWIVNKTGCDSMEIIERDGHFRICAARFVSYNEAADFIKEENLTAWVLHCKQL